jgi:hypothetical protein
VKVGDYIASKFTVIDDGKVIGIVTGFDEDKDPEFTVVYSTTGKGFGLTYSDYKSWYKVIKDEQVPEVIRQWSTTRVVG